MIGYSKDNRHRCIIIINKRKYSQESTSNVVIISAHIMRLKKTEQSPKLREFMTSGRPSTDSFTQQIFKIIFLRCVYTTQQVAQLVERNLLRNKLTSFC